MRTAYDALRRAVVKDFGRWYGREWSSISDEGKERVRTGIAYNHWTNPFLTNLSDLYIGSGVIRGKQSGGWCFEEEYGENLKKLKTPMVYHWWVFSSFSFDDWFELRGFKSKTEAAEFLKKQKKREDSLFYSFLYRW